MGTAEVCECVRTHQVHPYTGCVPFTACKSHPIKSAKCMSLAVMNDLVERDVKFTDTAITDELASQRSGVLSEPEVPPSTLLWLRG